MSSARPESTQRVSAARVDVLILSDRTFGFFFSSDIVEMYEYTQTKGRGGGCPLTLMADGTAVSTHFHESSS